MLTPKSDAKVGVFSDVISRFTGTFLRVLKNYPKSLRISRKILKGIKKAPQNRGAISDEYPLIVYVKIVLKILLREALIGLIGHAHTVQFIEHRFRTDVKIDPFIFVHLAQISTDFR